MTFAGSPDRVEARLVPEAGYELDPFRDQRLSAPAVARTGAGAPPGGCRPVRTAGGSSSGAGRTSSLAAAATSPGPMVLAARTLGIPAALTEADAELGLANRLAAPFAKRVFLAYPLATRTDSRYRVVGRPIPARSRVHSTSRGARDLRAAGGRPVLVVFGALAGARALNELVVETFGEVGPAILHISGARDYASLKGTRPAPRLPR